MIEEKWGYFQLLLGIHRVIPEEGEKSMLQFNSHRAKYSGECVNEMRDTRHNQLIDDGRTNRIKCQFSVRFSCSLIRRRRRTRERIEWNYINLQWISYLRSVHVMIASEGCYSTIWLLCVWWEGVRQSVDCHMGDASSASMWSEIGELRKARNRRKSDLKRNRSNLNAIIANYASIKYVFQKNLWQNQKRKK